MTRATGPGPRARRRLMLVGAAAIVTWTTALALAHHAHPSGPKRRAAAPPPRQLAKARAAPPQIQAWAAQAHIALAAVPSAAPASATPNRAPRDNDASDPAAAGPPPAKAPAVVRLARRWLRAQLAREARPETLGAMHAYRAPRGYVVDFAIHRAEGTQLGQLTIGATGRGARVTRLELGALADSGH